MKCTFCSEEIADNTEACSRCGRRQQGAPENYLPIHPSSNPPSTETHTGAYYVTTEQSLLEDTGWRCKDCGNFNVRSVICLKCGKDKNFVPSENPPAPVQKQSKVDELYEKGWKSFWDGFTESDKGKRIGHLSRSHGYLSMAYKAASDNEEKKGIAGLVALVLTHMGDCTNAETWAKAELAINPTNVFARLASYFIELDKLVGHKGFVTRADGSGFGLFASVLTTGVDVARVQNKKSAVKTAAIEAAKAIYNKARTDPEPNPVSWILWSLILLSIIENMWANNMKEPYLCNVLLNLPWNRFTDEEIEDLGEPIEEIQVEAHGFLGRLR